MGMQLLRRTPKGGGGILSSKGYVRFLVLEFEIFVIVFPALWR